MTTRTRTNYDEIVPKRLNSASQHALRALITWADYNYWVKDTNIMSDYTFDLLVREYQRRYPEDQTFLNKIGMW